MTTDALARTTMTLDEAFATPEARHELREPARPMPRGPFVVAWILSVVCALMVWIVLYALVLSGVQEHRSQSVLFGDLRQNLAAATTPIGGTIAPGTPIALINAPRAGLKHTVVVEGTAGNQLTEGPGHLANTPLPGQGGVSVLMGRSVMFGGVFAHIAAFRPGDRIAVTTGQGSFIYTVTDLRSPGQPVPAPPAAGQGRLVLMTSRAGGWRGDWAPKNIVLVDATLNGTPQAAPPGAPSAVEAAAKPMHRQPAALIPLLLWLQGLLLASVGIVWALARWGGRKTWIAGFPLMLALIWGATSVGLLLLPNLV